MRTLILLSVLALGPSALAQEIPPVPQLREDAAEVPAEPPDAGAAAEEVAPGTEGPVVPLPRRRPPPPAVEESSPEPAPPAAVVEEAEEGVPAEPVAPAEAEPPAPPRIYQSACPAVLLGQVEAKMLPPVEAGACGAQSPLSITAVLANGRMVPFSGAATLNCGMASALPAWIEAVDSYVRARENVGIESVLVSTSYMCRNVNNGSGGNLSFHAFADALDVTGFRLEDGRTVTVTGAWNGTEEQGRRIIRFAHDAACTGFTTVLGPEANAQHHDHLHLDLGCHGKTCTARICE